MVKMNYADALHLYRFVIDEGPNPDTDEEVLVTLLEPYEEEDLEWYEEVSEGDEDDLEPDQDPDISILKVVTMKTVKKFFGSTKWNWMQWIPEGLITMFAGPQGHGKSWLVAHLISVLTGAVRVWPDGKLYEGETGTVVLLETENMRGEYIDRMEALGISEEKVVFLGETEDDPYYIVDLIKDTEGVAVCTREIGAVAIIVDSLSGGHSFDENSDKMRLILKNLSTVAGLLQIPLILVHHTRKKSYRESPQVTVDRVRGSSTITQFCRSVVGVYRLVDDQSSPTRVEVIKANLCKPPEPFGFTIDDGGLKFGDAPTFARKVTKVEIAQGFWLMHWRTALKNNLQFLGNGLRV